MGGGTRGGGYGKEGRQAGGGGGGQAKGERLARRADERTGWWTGKVSNWTGRICDL